MCLMYEFMNQVQKKFFTLSNNCGNMKTVIRKFANEYISEIEDENTL
jgi:2-methylaconitate cis-trans-isomerase PrpF